MWKVKFSAKAEKTLKRLDSITKRRIESFVDDLIITNNPRLQGLALQGDLKGLWRYRVGDYRLVCQINDGELIVLVVDIGHRSVVYH